MNSAIYTRRFISMLQLIFIAATGFSQSITLTKKRPPIIDISAYQKIAIGDIVGPSGFKTDRSMDLSDQLTSILFNAKTLEVIDRNALGEILSSQKGSEIKAINETTTAELSKKMNSAIIILGRIQNESVYKEQKSVKNIIVVNGCYYSYWWHISGDITVQIKIIDIKTGKMLYSNPIVEKIDLDTKQECEAHKLGDVEPLLKETLAKLSVDVSKLVVPYDEYLTLNFENQAITLFKNPFKKLNHAIDCLKANDMATGLAILKAYADDKSLKPNLQEKARYNYGLGLFVAEQYEIATEQLKAANSAGSADALSVLQKIDEEKASIKKRDDMIAKAAEYKKRAQEEPSKPAEDDKPAVVKKTTAKKKTVKGHS